jgi:hypothetical protein
MGHLLFWREEIEQKCRDAGLPFVLPIIEMPEREIVPRAPIDPHKTVWFAALVDSEAAITLNCRLRNNRTEYSTGFSISNTCKLLLVEAQRLFGGSLNGPYKYSEHQKPYWQLDFSPSKVLEVIPIILPYLIAKKHVAELVLEAQHILRARRNSGLPRPEDVSLRLGELYSQVRRLNKRGTLEAPQQ